MKTLAMAFERNVYGVVASFIFALMLFMQCCSGVAQGADLATSKTEGIMVANAEFTANQHEMAGELNYETPQKFYHSVLKDLTTEQKMENGRSYHVELITVNVSTFDGRMWNAIEKIVNQDGKLEMIKGLDGATGKDVYMFSLKNNSAK